MKSIIFKIFPFLTWFDDYTTGKFRIDFLAGLTVALVLIPQSMAYAQLAGLPTYYGLYASFIPPMLAALFGSSRQLQTGPVAIVSLMSAASLEPLATAGSEAFIAYAIILAFTVGIFQLLLGVLRLGLIINFLSHPVVNGFSNAAAIIIGSSQLSKIFGVYVDNAPHHYETIYNVFVSAFNFTHIPTLLIALLAIGIMVTIKKINPKLPFVLVAVVITTCISYFTGYVDNKDVNISQFSSITFQNKIKDFNRIVDKNQAFGEKLSKLNKSKEEILSGGHNGQKLIKVTSELELLNYNIKANKEKLRDIRKVVRDSKFAAIGEGENLAFIPIESVPKNEEYEGSLWRMKIGNNKLDETKLFVMGGGDVVGEIPEGLPEFKMPDITFSSFMTLLPFAIIISLLGFMEAIAIAKAMAAKTGQKIDPNQELIGQGLANIVGSFSQSYAVSGSFSRSAVNLSAGAVSGLSSVVTSLIVVVVLIFFTPLLYFLPKAVLATIIILAVIGLINIKGIIHVWKAKWYDGAILMITFICTLIFAPHLENGIYVGVVLSLAVYLYKSMRPKVTHLSRRPDDHSLRDAEKHGLPECDHLVLLRFESPLFFANASHLEEEVNLKIAEKKDLRALLFVCNAMVDIDATGEEALTLLIPTLRAEGYDVAFSGITDAVAEIMQRTHLLEIIGPENIYPTMEDGILGLYEKSHYDHVEPHCSLAYNYEQHSKKKKKE